MSDFQSGKPASGGNLFTGGAPGRLVPEIADGFAGDPALAASLAPRGDLAGASRAAARRVVKKTEPNPLFEQYADGPSTDSDPSDNALKRLLSPYVGEGGIKIPGTGGRATLMPRTPLNPPDAPTRPDGRELLPDPPEPSRE